MTRPTTLSTTAVVAFWLPLAATWLMMAAEGPYISAIVARLPDPAYNLAAYGVAFSLAWLAESPIMMLLTAATALVEGRASFLALRRFTLLLNGLVTALMVACVLPPVFTLLADRLMSLPPDIARLTHLATLALIPWPAAIGYRRFYQGVLVRHHLTRRVAYGTVVRLGSMSLTAACLASWSRLPGALVGTLALTSGVLAEAVASRFMARHVVRTLLSASGPAGSRLSLREIARFYAPLAMTSAISMAAGPLVTVFLGRGRAPVESLAVWPVVGAFVFLLRSGGIAYQEVAVALGGARHEHAGTVAAAARWLAAAVTLLAAGVLFSPLADVWFRHIVGLSEELARFALLPARVLVLLPALEYLLSLQRARWIVDRRTGVVTAATVLEALGLGAALFAGVVVLGWTGALAAALALSAGRLLANGYLEVQALRSRPGPA